jgi:hypothetical protein
MIERERDVRARLPWSVSQPRHCLRLRHRVEGGFNEQDDDGDDGDDGDDDTTECVAAENSDVAAILDAPPQRCGHQHQSRHHLTMHWQNSMR